MKIMYKMNANENNGINMNVDVEISERLVKLLTYVSGKLAKQSCDAQDILNELRENPLEDSIHFDSEAILKWLSKLPEWAAFKLKVSNPLTLRVFRKDLEEKYRALLKKYKVPENYFMLTASEYEEKKKKDAERRKKK